MFFKYLVRAEKGVSLLELTIALPILLMLVMGIFELSQDLHRKQVASDAAKEGTRIVAQIVALNPYNDDDLSSGACVDSSDLPKCEELVAGAFTQREMAKKRVCDHLLTSLNYSNIDEVDKRWKVAVKVNCEPDSAGEIFPLISVNVRESNSANSCVFCTDNAGFSIGSLANIRVKAESTMALRYQEG